MTISLEKVGKRFNREWIFRNLNFSFDEAASVAITGPNGSGKSTLLQVIAGSLLPSEGKVKYIFDQQEIPGDRFYQHIAFCAPYLDLIEEFTLAEFLEFHFKFKKLRSGIDLEALPEFLQLGHAISKPLKNFSTGMRQRVKLGICFYSGSPVLLLDEPATNLDKKGIDWYLSEVEKIKDNKLIVVSSNVEAEYSFCKQSIHIMDFK